MLENQTGYNILIVKMQQPAFLGKKPEEQTALKEQFAREKTQVLDALEKDLAIPAITGLQTTETAQWASEKQLQGTIP